MPLSEHEQNVLAQMERALYAEDPHLATRLASPHSLRRRRRVVLGAVGALVGMALVVCGVVWQMVWLGAAGFLVMVIAVVVAVTRPAGRASEQRSRSRDPGPSRGPSGAKGRSSGRPQRPTGFMDRLEERWEKRQGSEW